MLVLKILWMEFTGSMKGWRQNISIGDRCLYMNISGGVAQGSIEKVSDGLARVKTKTYAAEVMQWIEIDSLYPAN